MAIVRRTSNGVIETFSGTAGTGHTINLSDAAIGDVRTCEISGNPDGTGTVGSLTLPSGWSWAGTQTETGAASTGMLSVIYRVVQSGDTLTSATLALTYNNSVMVASTAETWEGVDTSQVLDQTVPTYATGGSPPVSPSITTQTDGALLICAALVDGAPTWGDTDIPSGFTLNGTASNNPPSNGQNHGSAYQIQATAGASGTKAWTNGGTEEYVAMTYALRPAAEGITSVTPEEFDMDESDVDVASTGGVFDASANDVYISDADTLAGSVNEVDISSAINTESTTLINLDLTQLSGTELDNLHTLGPGTRYIIVDATGGEYSFEITLHRPEGFVMSLGAGTPGASTSRLTAPATKTTGDFDAGRFEEAANPATAVDITADNYTEMVWSIEGKALSRTVQYDFRVTKNGVVIGTYTETPQVTITAGGAETANLADTVGVTDSISNVGAFIRSITESLGITDALSNVGVFFRSVLDSVGITDAISNVKSVFQSIADSVGITDTISKITGFFRTVIDSVGVTDIINAVASLIASIADSVGITDAVSRIGTFYRSISDSTGVTDTFVAIASFFRSFFETVGITDTLSRTGVFFRAISDSVGITDTINAVASLVASISDTVGVTDSLSKLGVFFRSLSDSVGITDVMSRIGGFIRAISDAVGITDFFNAFLPSGANFVTIFDDVGITDTISNIRALFSHHTDSVGITDTLTNLGAFIRNVSDAVGITDIISLVGNYFRSISDSTGVTDVLLKSLGFFKSIADTVGITDTLSSIVLLVRAIVDTVGITDAITKVFGFVSFISDTVGITDTLSKLGAFIRGISDTVGITDTVSRIGQFFRNISDTIGLTDIISTFSGLKWKELYDFESRVTTILLLDSRVTLVKKLESEITLVKKLDSTIEGD